MNAGHRWQAGWIDPFTRLPAWLGRDGFASVAEARDSALRHSPARADIFIVGPEGVVIEAIPRRDGVPSAMAAGAPV